MGLQVDLDDGGADLTVELRVGVLSLGLSEDGLDDDLEDVLGDCEAFSFLSDEASFSQKLTVTNEHLSELSDLSLQVVRRDLIEYKSDFLDIVLL